MVMPETIDYLKSEIERLEALPKAALIRENLERLNRAVRDAEASMEPTEKFYRKIKRHKARYPKEKGRKYREGVPEQAIRQPAGHV